MIDLRRMKNETLAKLYSRSPFLVKKWADGARVMEFSDSPWAPLSREIPACRLALVTTGGVHLHSQPPFDMSDPLGDPTFREIPRETSPEGLTISHIYYDHSDADRDINVVFPLERAMALQQAGDIKAVSSRHFSFMGHIDGEHLNRLVHETAPRVAASLKADGADIVILTPA